MTSRSFFLLGLVVLLITTTVSSCSSGAHLTMMSADKMPAEVLASSMTVQTAYRFAAANPDVMKEIFCYCGCDSLGHTSNYDCYISNVSENGYITFEQHGLACSTCVDITQGVMRMLRDGKSTAEAKAYIDETYGKYLLPQAQ